MQSHTKTRLEQGINRMIDIIYTINLKIMRHFPYFVHKCLLKLIEYVVRYHFIYVDIEL